MKQLIIGLVATFAVGTAFAQTAPAAAPAPAATAVAAPAPQEAPETVTPAEGVFTNTAQVPTTPVVNTAPKVPMGVIAAAAGGLLVIAAVAGGDSDDQPSSP